MFQIKEGITGNAYGPTVMKVSQSLQYETIQRTEYLNATNSLALRYESDVYLECEAYRQAGTTQA